MKSVSCLKVLKVGVVLGEGQGNLSLLLNFRVDTVPGISQNLSVETKN